MHRQQIGAGTAAAGIKLDAEHTQRVEAETDGAFGVTRLDVEEEALAPFFALVLATAFTEIAVQVNIGGAQAGLAVSDKVGVGSRCKESRTDSEAKQMNRRKCPI